VELDVNPKKATPKQGAIFVNCKMAINLMSGNSPLGIKLREKSYINDRKPGRLMQQLWTPRDGKLEDFDCQIDFCV